MRTDYYCKLRSFIIKINCYFLNNLHSEITILLHNFTTIAVIKIFYTEIFNGASSINTNHKKTIEKIK